MHELEASLSRRHLLKPTVGTALSGVFGLAAAKRPDLIRIENEKPGTADWMLSKTRVAPATKYRCPWIEGYCSRTSIKARESLAIMVSTNPPSPFVIDVYRLGYYGGKGGRHMARIGPFKGKVQPDPGISDERLRECQWEPATKLVVPDDWTSGVYLGKLTSEKNGLQSYFVFIVRDDRACDVLFQSSDATWSAYNRWPDVWSMYDDGVKKATEWFVGPGVRVSFDRPYGKYRQVLDAPLSQGSGEFSCGNFRWPSGWSSAVTTSRTSATSILTSMRKACCAQRPGSRWGTMNTGPRRCSTTSKGRSIMA